MTSEVKPRKWGVRLFLAEVAIGVMVLFLWTPVAALLGIAQPWIMILFTVAWVIFWMAPVGTRLRDLLTNLIYRG